MKAMAIGDLGFFYHSVNEKRIVGIVEVSRFIILMILIRQVVLAWSMSRR